MSALVVLLMAASAVGWGALALRLAGVLPALAWRERLAWAFGLGIGILGWLAFFPPLLGQTRPWVFALCLAPGLPGLRLLGAPPEEEKPTSWTWTLLALAAVLALGDLAEGLAPPTDADSLAYHFAIPRDILRQGHLIFIPRAADGAVPLLPQMTCMLALALGGETAMTLWAGLSGWAPVLLTYAVARRYMERDWALGLAVAVAGMPAVLYGGGSGQVEVRMAAFTTMAVLAVMEARARPGRDRGGLGWAVLAGLAAGFCMASKYPGLLVVFLCGLAVWAQRGGLARAAAFSLAALAAGAQWYGWNGWNTGDPVFPMLWGHVPYHVGVPWNDAQDALFRKWASQVEVVLPKTISLFLTYPVMATFFPVEGIDSGRTGLGVLPALLAPFAALAGWRHRRHPTVRAWAMAALIGLGFYVLWFWFGASQRVRHYLPLMPVVLIGLLAAALRVAPRRALAAGLGAVLLIQAGGQAVFARNFVHRLVAGESREAFLERNVGFGYAVAWANANLPPDAVVATTQRTWLYLLETKGALLVTPFQSAEVDSRAENTDPGLAWRQLRARGVTHVMTGLSRERARDLEAAGESGPDLMPVRLEARGCAQVMAELHGPAPTVSRTLGTKAGFGARSTVTVYVLSDDPACGREKAP